MSIDIQIRELSTVSDLAAANEVFEQVWESADSVVQVDLLRAMALSGGYVAGAYVGDKIVGAAMGFLAKSRPDDVVHLHSHQVGVLPEAQGMHVGLNLKLHQRSWALEHGIDDVQWTFDPLLARNARFNLARLGARPIAYHVDFYGQMLDAVNAGVDSDRLLVTWPLTSLGVLSALAGSLPTVTEAPHVGLSVGPRREPVTHDNEGACPQVWAIPPDMAAIRREAPAIAQEWREVTRHLFMTKLAERATFAFLPGRGYLVCTEMKVEEPSSATTSSS